MPLTERTFIAYIFLQTQRHWSSTRTKQSKTIVSNCYCSYGVLLEVAGVYFTFGVRAHKYVINVQPRLQSIPFGGCVAIVWRHDWVHGPMMPARKECWCQWNVRMWWPFEKSDRAGGLNLCETRLPYINTFFTRILVSDLHHNVDDNILFPASLVIRAYCGPVTPCMSESLCSKSFQWLSIWSSLDNGLRFLPSIPLSPPRLLPFFLSPWFLKIRRV